MGLLVSSADRGCPIVRGAESRIALPFKDPKAGDGTPQQNELYAKVSREIAVEMAYVFGRVKSAVEARTARGGAIH